MKSIRKIVLAVMASTLLLCGCSNKPTKLSSDKVLYEISINETDPIKDIFDDLVEESLYETDVWYKLNEDIYRNLNEVEINYFKYSHFKETFDSKLAALPEETQAEVNKYINDNYQDEVFMYDHLCGLVEQLMDAKQEHPSLFPVVSVLYEKINDFIKNGTQDEQKGFCIFMQMNDVSKEYALKAVIKSSPFGLFMLYFVYSVEYKIAFTLLWEQLSPEDQALVKAFTSKYMVALQTIGANFYSLFEEFKIYYFGE